MLTEDLLRVSGRTRDALLQFKATYALGLLVRLNNGQK